jgi:hypothetical protein
MNTLAVTPNNESEMKLILDFLKKLNLTPLMMTEEEWEDMEDIRDADARRNQEATNFDDFVKELGFEPKLLETA